MAGKAASTVITQTHGPQFGSAAAADRLGASTLAGNPAIVTLVSLSLILLTFFAVLNSAADVDLRRTRAIVVSLQKAFGRTEDAADVARVTAQDALRVSVSEIFASIMPTEPYAKARGGDRLDIDVPAAALFADDGVTVRNPLPILDRVVAVMSSPPRAMRYELIVADALPENQERVAALAAALVARGMPPGTLSVGVGAGGFGAVSTRALRFTFLVLDVAADPLPARVGGKAS